MCEQYEKSVDADKYEKCMRKFKKKHGKTTAVLYLDSLVIHKNPRAIALYKELDITMILSPVYSPKYMSMELVNA